jgi:hypothetical protein
VCVKKNTVPYNFCGNGIETEEKKKMLGPRNYMKKKEDS